MNSLRKLSSLTQFARCYSTTTAEFVNRNPRNLERLRIARKPDGYHLDKPGRKFWHKLTLTASNRIVTAQVVHYMNGPIIEAKSSEWCLRKQLYSVNDTCAYMALGKILAQRCLQSGIVEMTCDIQPTKGGKIEKFLNEVVNSGIRLQEMDVYKKPSPWDMHRPEKPWEITEE